MSLETKNATSQGTNIFFIVLLVLSLINIISLFGRANQVKELKAKVSQQALIIQEKDKQLESDKVLYTSLAARLHQEIKKVGDLEGKLKK